MKNRLKELRNVHQKSQADIARALGISRQAINGFESGKFDPSLEMAFKIARLLAVSIEDIFIYEAESSMQPFTQSFKKYFGRERFAPKAINAIKFAGNEARRSKQAQVQPEHLLRGLLADSTSTSARVLRVSGVTRKVLTDDHSFVFQGTPKLSSQSRAILDLALKKVQQEGRKSIGTEHLLWGWIQRLKTDETLTSLIQRYEIDVESLSYQLAEIV